MYIKLFGAVLILAGCGGCGLLMAHNYRKEVAALHQLADAIQGMICQLEYRLTPLPELCRFGAGQSGGAISAFLLNLAQKMDNLEAADVVQNVRAAVEETPGLPPRAATQLQVLGQTLGSFDLEGQVAAMKHCRTVCLAQLETLEHQQSQRLRSYQTLGFCAGAAMAILLL